jgi:hypothetical protein
MKCQFYGPLEKEIHKYLEINAAFREMPANSSITNIGAQKPIEVFRTQRLAKSSVVVNICCQGN